MAPDVELDKQLEETIKNFLAKNPNYDRSKLVSKGANIGGAYGYRADLGITLRSNLEANYARILKHQGVQFVYEPKVFTLSNGKVYIPDFYLPKTDEYVEVKGFFKARDHDKYAVFSADYPNIRWRVVVQTSPEWKAMRKKYKRYIPNWEGTH